MSQERCPCLVPPYIRSKYTRVKPRHCPIHQPDPSVRPKNDVAHAEVTVGKDKRPGVIERFGVRTGGTDYVATTISQGYTVSYVQLAVVKRRQRGVIRKGSARLVEHVTIQLLRNICNGARD